MTVKQGSRGQTDEWVPVTGIAPSGALGAAGMRARSSGAAESPAPAQERRPPRTDPALSRLELERSRAEQRAEEAETRARIAEEELARFRQRAAAGEKALREVQKLRRRAAAGERVAKAARIAARDRSAEAPDPAASEALNLNTASFEALRTAGLSITQSARLISQREQLGGFRSLDDLLRLYGLPRELKDFLREHCRV